MPKFYDNTYKWRLYEAYRAGHTITELCNTSGITDKPLREWFGKFEQEYTSLKSIGYVCGGAQAVIEALIETVGENGTIMMPTQSWKNLDPETGVHGKVDEKDWPLIRENWPAYDKK